MTTLTMTFDLNSICDGKRFADMGVQEMCDVVRKIGDGTNKVTVKDGKEVVCYYDPETRNVYYTRTIVGEVFKMMFESMYGK